MNKTELLAKSEGVRDCYKHIERQIRREQALLVNERKLYSDFGMFEDCGDSYREAVIRREARIDALVEQKISLEKYAKKLKHQAEEIEGSGSRMEGR